MLGRKIFLFTEALMKAFIAGGTLGMVASGAMELGFVIAASDWLATFRQEHAVIILGWGGGLAGIALQLLSLSRT